MTASTTLATRHAFVLRMTRSSPTATWRYVLISAEDGTRKICEDPSAIVAMLASIADGPIKTINPPDHSVP